MSTKNAVLILAGFITLMTSVVVVILLAQGFQEKALDVAGAYGGSFLLVLLLGGFAYLEGNER